MTQRVQPFTSSYNLPKAANGPFTAQLLWCHSGLHYSPAYQWRGLTQRGPCRNKEAGEEASASPRPCPDEPPTGDTESSATLLMSSRSPEKLLQTGHQGRPSLEISFLPFSTLQQQVWGEQCASCLSLAMKRRKWRCEIGVSHKCWMNESAWSHSCMSTAYMQHELFDTTLQGGKLKLGRLWNGYFLQFRNSIYEIYGWASCDYREILNAKEGINFTKKTPPSNWNY